MGPSNVIIGDQDSPVELPQTTVPYEAVAEVQNAAKYSKSAEFKKIKEHFAARVEFYKAYLPDGRAVGTLSADEAAGYWVAATVIIGELQNVISAYEQAAEAVKEQ